MLVGRVPESLLAEAYDGSFAGNPGLCADNGKRVAKYCFIASAFMLLFSVACFVLIKSRAKDCNNLTNRGFSWDMKHFHVVSFDEGEILGSLIPRNLIGKCGSGNV
ncbi:putative non-specific serine/threonine protein kinase [Helianthus anomalus]